MTAGGVKVAEVLEAVRRRRALLAPETAGYLVLGAADQLARSPSLIDVQRCGLLLDGGRVVVAPSPPSAAVDAERSLRDLLRRLLDAASGRAPALHAVAQGAARGNVAVLVAELESALIPVNRSAAGRALARLARDTVRARAEAAAPATGSVASPAADLGSAVAVTAEVAAFAPTAEPEEATAEDTEPLAIAPGDDEVEPGDDEAALVEDDEVLEPPVAQESEPIPLVTSRSASTSDLDDLLAARLSSIPPPAAVIAPPPVDRAPSPRPPIASPLPPPASPPPPVLVDRAPSPPAPIASPAPPLVAVTPEPPAYALPPPRTPPVPAAAQVAPERESQGPDRPSHPSGSMRGVDELLHDFMSTSSRKEERIARDLRKMVGVAATPDPPPLTLGARPDETPFHNVSGVDFHTTTPPPRGMTAQSVAPTAEDDPLSRRSTRRNVYIALAAISILTVGAITLFRLDPGSLSGRTAEVVEGEKREAAAAAASIAARNAAGACRATVVVSDIPTGAELLVRSGVAPVDVERVPSRTRLEFVALIDGYAPRRGVVPTGVEWDEKGGKPRFELPIQLDKSRSKSGTLDPWPAAEAGSVVGGQGPPGTVHVVTSPRGAEVWMVAGGGPEAKLEALPCRAGLELLVAGAAQGQPFRRRLRVDAAQLTPEPSANTATARISAK